MGVRVTFYDESLLRGMAQLAAHWPKELPIVMETLAALGKEFARDIVTEMIYATPQRGEYRRTRMLIRSIYSAVRQEGTTHLISVGASAHYAAFNEFGTYESWLGENADRQIIEASRGKQGSRDTLILLKTEFGDPQGGLEPRPFILPALVMLERRLPEFIWRSLERVVQE
jgi:hypothetical protein